MHKKLFFFAWLVCASIYCFAQYKNDNVLYRLVYFQDLCKTMEENPGYLLIDVRSKGEYEDTSASVNYNIGRFRDAKNIPVQELGTRLNEIKDYKDQPVFVYCSHSQRSRRASKMLADSGFTKIFNINSGFSSTHLFPASSVECILARTEHNTPYAILSPQDLNEILEKGGKNNLLIDVRPDSAYNGISTNEKLNAFGKVKGARHMTRADLEKKSEELEAFKKDPARKIILIDAFGDESARAATYLTEKGFGNVAILFNGIDAWNSTSKEELPGKDKFLEKRAAYKIVTSTEFPQFATRADLLLLDIRSKEEFDNQSKDSWRNIGILKGAMNVPLAELDPKAPAISSFMNKPVIVYSFSGGEDVYKAAKKLTDAGFRDVSVLSGGLFNLRWTAHNVRGKETIDDMVVNIPDANL